MVRRLFAGLDLGKKNDYTAVALLDRQREFRDPLPGSDRPREVAVYTLRQLDRVRQESYEGVADSVATLFNLPVMRAAKLAVDETGVGTAVTDMLRARDLSPYAVTITGGDTVSRKGKDLRIPKRDLVTTVAVLLETRRLKVPKALPLARTLLDELHNFKVKVSPLGHDSYGAGGEWREGQHDDLVLAVALAAWLGEHGTGVGTLFEPPLMTHVDVNSGDYADTGFGFLDDDSPGWWD